MESRAEERTCDPPCLGLCWSGRWIGAVVVRRGGGAADKRQWWWWHPIIEVRVWVMIVMSSVDYSDYRS
jgi:hypothetical protein